MHIGISNLALVGPIQGNAFISEKMREAASNVTDLSADNSISIGVTGTPSEERKSITTI